MRPLTRRAMIAATLAAGCARAEEQNGDLVGGDSAAILPIALAGGIILPVSVNGGRPAPFTLDTGSTATIFDSVFAAENNLRPTGTSGNVVGVNGGHAVFESITGVRLSCAGFAFPPQEAAILQLPNHIADRGARPRLAGILGLTSLGTQALRINLAAGTLTVLAAGAPPAPGAIVLPLATALHFATNDPASPSFSRATVAATLDGMGVDLTLDTGSGGGVMLNNHFVRANDLLARYAKHVDMMIAGGIDGAFHVSHTIGNQLSLGDYSQTGFFLTLARDAPPPPAPSSYRGHFGDDARRRARPDDTVAGTLGLAFLRQFVLFIDVANQRLAFEPGGLPHTPPRFVSAGLSLDKPAYDYFSVLSVVPGTPAAAAGLDEGDRIIAINAIPATDLALFDYGRMELHGPVTLRPASGADRTLRAIQLLP